MTNNYIIHKIFKVGEKPLGGACSDTSFNCKLFLSKKLSIIGMLAVAPT
jgi:hypothetical protein